ncbi:hypothetical protein R6U77_02005 [Lysinibacillus louembei]|uniref:SWIM-type domain-containing protein n=1 Tax=Lysinibacillus louembei TaxID=1470088 RepID=A0ABZ0RW89_9BACI|nr:hypothetical protein [Lysinibacillus louembei]WPK12492.1 hypothetical protein R6U77_02005 [Lysinibacillus louembei]
MALSISDVARRYSAFIRQQLEEMERLLQPSSIEDEELVRRAVFSVRNKSVLFERFLPQKDVLFTVVQDVRPAEVTVDFGQQLIICTCPQQNCCRHKLGVILGLYQYLGSVQEWTSKWRAQKNVHLKSLATERSPESWQRMVDEVMQHSLHGAKAIESYSISALLTTTHTKLQRYTPLEREWQPLFKLFMELSVLNKLWIHLNHTNSPIDNYYFEAAMNHRLDIVHTIVSELGSKSRLFATDPFYDAIQDLVRELLFERSGRPQIRFQFYLTIWTEVFTEKARYEKELFLLEKLHTTSDFPMTVNRTLFYVLLKDCEKLDEQLSYLEQSQLAFYLPIAKLALKHYMEGLQLLLKVILPFLENFIHTTLAPQQRPLFIKDINALYSAIELSEQEAVILYQAFGRYGIQPYADFLLQKARYEEWVALQQLYPSSISHLEARGLKTVIQEAPAAVLPLYHYYALEELRQKSRMNYKQAIRIWKSMKSAAKKAGKMTYWTNYMQTMQQKYKRLRALQEELDKSNLI